MTKRKDDGGMDLGDENASSAPEDTAKDTHSSHKGPAKKQAPATPDPDDERLERQKEADARKDEAADRGRPE